MPLTTQEQADNVRFVFKPPGVVLPGWLALVCGLALLFSCLGFLISLFLVQDKRQDIRDLTQEIRILQVHVADIENVLIRGGIAKRDDFPEWESKPKQEEGETP